MTSFKCSRYCVCPGQVSRQTKKTGRKPPARLAGLEVRSLSLKSRAAMPQRACDLGAIQIGVTPKNHGLLLLKMTSISRGFGVLNGFDFFQVWVQTHLLYLSPYSLLVSVGYRNHAWNTIVLERTCDPLKRKTMGRAWPHFNAVCPVQSM